MRIIDRRKKYKVENLQQILMFRAGNFYTICEEDAIYFVGRFGFQLKSMGKYVQAGFPQNALEKYCQKLEEEKIGYLVFEKNEDGEYQQTKIYEGAHEIPYFAQETLVSKSGEKIYSNNINSNSLLNDIIQDLWELVKKYQDRLIEKY